MDELIKEMERFKDLTSSFTLADVAIVIFLSFVLSLIMGWVYRGTHRGTSYSQAFAQTLVIMCMVTALIMLIIGSNIARAFSLVGALSVIRFRNAVKETRDIGFMFLVMAIGMACGTRFYMLAVFATVSFSGVIYFLFNLDIFSKQVTEQVLRVRLPLDEAYERELEAVFRDHLEENRLVSMESVSGGTLQELVYIVIIKHGSSAQALIEAVRKATDNNKVVLVTGQQDVDL